MNIAVKESLAVYARKHSPVVFSRPEDFVRAGDRIQASAYRELIDQNNTGNHTLDFLTEVSKSACDSSVKVREAIGSYQTPVPYGATPLALDLRKVAALIGAGFPTRVYYVSLSGFDTHASQSGGRNYLLRGLGEGLHFVPGRSETDLPREGCGAHDVQRIRAESAGERQGGNRSWDRRGRCS